MTVYDSYVNMLRDTTEAMSAAIAGVDYLEVLPYDFAFRVPNDFSRRIARNVQNILKEEARFDKVVDPAAGSYYVEMLTEKIAGGGTRTTLPAATPSSAATSIPTSSRRPVTRLLPRLSPVIFQPAWGR